ncbi:MAG: hypothetical protein SFU56_01940 [Capsulimonadales bacterium]|nr:hypothetical protein [Capsulimonadales bacterium]
MAAALGRVNVPLLLHRLFAIDFRALGWFRIVLGLMLIRDYLTRIPDIAAHYTETGVMPIRSAQAYYNTDFQVFVSHYSWNGSYEWSLTLMILGIVAAIVFILGWKTRLATFVSWLLVIGLHTRYPLVQEGSDVYLRQMLFWSLFLPLGARYSVDGLAAQHVAHHRSLPRTVLSVASAGLLLQVAIVYWFNAITKSGPQWRTDFTALHYALNLEAFTRPLGLWWRDHLHWTLAPLTMAVFYLEALGPFLPFVPWRTESVRVWVASLFITFHLFGIGLLMDVGAFYYVAALPWVLYLPSTFWDRFERIGGRLPASHLTNAARHLRDALIDWRSRRIARLIEQGAPVPRLGLSLPGQIVAFFFLNYIVLWNLHDSGVTWANRHLPPANREIMFLTRVDQYWGMFAPYPMTADAWVVLPALTADETLFDLYKMTAPVNYDKPRSVKEFYRNTRWRKYLTNLYEPRFSNQRIFYCQWLAREWNRTHHGPQALISLWYCVVEELTVPEGRQPKRTLRVLHTYSNLADKTTGLLRAVSTPANGEYPPGTPPELIPAPTSEPASKPVEGAAPHGVNRSTQPEKNLQKR